MGWVLTYGDHVEITFQMLPKFSEWFHVGQMSWIHFKCSQIVIADKDPGTFNQSSQCSQHVITGPRYPCPQCMALLSIGAIEEIMGVSQTMMFLDDYSKRLSSGVEDDAAVTRSFHSMVVGFPWLEEFGVQGSTEVGR